VSRRLFGTDGVRGIANVEPMTSETALRLGRALAHVSKRSPRRHKILIGKDTRSRATCSRRPWPRHLLDGRRRAAGRAAPDAGIAFLTRALRADAGVVISASHNPFQDNGIKFFSPAGFKLPDELENEIEHLVVSDSIDTLRPTATRSARRSASTTRSAATTSSRRTASRGTSRSTA
jgi:phosphoglucosamine mutase